MEQKRTKLALAIQQKITVYNAAILQLVHATSLSPSALLSRIDVINKEHDKSLKNLIMKGC